MSPIHSRIARTVAGLGAVAALAVPSGFVEIRFLGGGQVGQRWHEHVTG